MSDELPRLMTVDEVSEYFRTKGLHYVLRNRQNWPQYRIANQSLFSAEHVMQILAMHEVRGDVKDPAPAPQAEGRVTRGQR